MFYDGVKNVFNQIVNRRNALSQNIVESNRLDYEQMRAIYNTGLGSKIIRLKSGYSLNDTLQFEGEADESTYNAKLAKSVKLASKYMLGFGRGIIVIHKRGDNLAEPLTKGTDIDDCKISVFSGDMITPGVVSLDLNNERYMQPTYYMVRGQSIHHTRVIDFSYIKPTEIDLPEYQYGGISEFELIYNQIINDGIVERSSASIIEKNANWVYKIVGFKEALRAKQDDAVIQYFSQVEDMRSMYGAVLIDAEDSAENIAQTLTNLSEVDQISLRRLSMVTGIPLSILVGENVKGLNSSGSSERATFQDMIEGLQSDYLIDQINQLLRIFGMDPAKFKDNQGETALDRIDYDTKATEIAFKLWQMGEDGAKYLNDKGVTQKDDWDEFWKEAEEDLTGELENETNQIL